MPHHFRISNKELGIVGLIRRGEGQWAVYLWKWGIASDKWWRQSIEDGTAQERPLVDEIKKAIGDDKQ